MLKKMKIDDNFFTTFILLPSAIGYMTYITKTIGLSIKNINYNWLTKDIGDIYHIFLIQILQFAPKARVWTAPEGDILWWAGPMWVFLNVRSLLRGAHGVSMKPFLLEVSNLYSPLLAEGMGEKIS